MTRSHKILQLPLFYHEKRSVHTFSISLCDLLCVFLLAHIDTSHCISTQYTYKKQDTRESEKPKDVSKDVCSGAMGVSIGPKSVKAQPCTKQVIFDLTKLTAFDR